MALARGSKESIQRVDNSRGKVLLSALTCRYACPGSASLLRIILLACLGALAMFAGFTYPLLRAEQLQVVSSGDRLANRHADPLPQDDARAQGGEVDNSTLDSAFLSFAAIDPNEEQEKRKIKMILDGNEIEWRNAHSSSTYQMRMDHYVDVNRARRRLKPRYESWLFQLQNPRYRPSWPRFRQLLQAWSRNKRHDLQVMEEVWGAIKSPIDNFFSSSMKQDGNRSKRYKTCAVVGNSGILLGRSFGSFIDSHDVVVRLNNARVKSFEESVGTKTSISFVNSNVYHSCARRLECFCHPYGNVPIVMYLCQVHHMMDIAFCEPNHNAPVLITDARFDVLCARLVKWYSVKNYVEATGNPIQKWDKDHDARDFHYSSGFQAIVLALGLCEKVDLFGFGKSLEAKHHYHTNQKTELELHDYAAEYLLYDDLVFNRTTKIPFLREAGITLPQVNIYK